MALRSFLENQICDLLFITDPNNSWYLDDDFGETYQKVIKHFSSRYEEGSVCFFGSSMSGYGAIYHALQINANAIASNPQINLNISKDYAWDELRLHIEELGRRHVNLDEVAAKLWRDSAIYLIHGHDDIDTINADLFLRSAPPNKKIIIQTLDLDTHVMFFGKKVTYVYEAMDLLGRFRDRLDLKKVISELMPEDKTNKRQRRMERALVNIADPFHSLKSTGEEVLWQYRYLHEAPGRQVFFSNVGFYANGSLTGAYCFYDGERWRLVSPRPTINDNLMAQSHCETRGVLSQIGNNGLINDKWWIRNDKESEIDVEGSNSEFTLNLRLVNSRNIFINSSLSLSAECCRSLHGKYMTLSAEMFVSIGEAYLTLGGYGDSGYHHRNSGKCEPGVWKSMFVCEQFLSIDSDHKDAVFVRANFASDGKPKMVRLRNIRLNVGYFPMGLD